MAPPAGLPLRLLKAAPAAALSTDPPASTQPPPPAAGYFHPALNARTLVCGSGAEFWLRSTADPQSVLKALHARGLETLIVADDGQHCPHFTAAARNFPGTVWASPLAASVLVHRLREDALLKLPTRTVHGVLLLINGLGVLLSGPSGSGKSGLALELVAGGHALVADDAIEFCRVAPGCVLGRCPPPLAGFIHTPDLGVLDVARLYGPRAVVHRARLDLVIDLSPEPATRTQATATRDLHGRRAPYPLLGESLPAISLQPRVGHNLAVWVETACADHRARLAGHAADKALALRHQQLLGRAAAANLRRPI